MGVFDFVKNAGAKIGIGTSTEEDAAAEKAAADAAAAEAAERAARDAKVAARRREVVKANAAAAQADKDKAAAERKERLAQRRQDAVKARKRAAAKERMTEYKKSNELEQYVAGLGIEMGDIDVRFDNGTAYISGEAADEATKERIILAIGNAQGVGKVDEEMTVAEPSDPSHFHTVASGDTLWGVAEKVYGDGSRYPEIFEANKPMLKDPDMIFPGQVLRCPMGDE